MSDIKYLALTYINLQDNLTIQEKNNLAKFVVEATEDKVIELLVEGEILNEAGGLAVVGSKNLVIGSTPYSGIMSIDQLQTAVNSALKRSQEVGRQRGWQTGEEAGYETGMQTGATGAFAAAAIAALVITVSYKVYKRFLSKAARACKNLAGDAKTSCMNKYKRESLKAQVTELQKGRSICSKSKDPGKCTLKIDKKLHNIKVKLGAV
jgi:flagellar biosynthesis/type III secretory pathway protein FliH